MEAAARDPRTKVDRPLWWGNHLGEVRWQLDAARLLVHPVLRGRGVPRGNGRPVLLLPGFLAGDYTLAPMALWLRRIGYRPARAGFLTNTGCSQETLERLESRAQALADETGRRVGLIGHSRGAHQSKVLAVRRPDLVSHVIGLGGGLSRQMDVSAPTAAAVALFRALQRRSPDREQQGCLAEDCRCSFTRDYSAPFPEERPADQHLLEGRWRRPLAVLRGPIRVQRRGQRDPRRPGTQPPGLRRDRDRPCRPGLLTR